MSPPPPLPPPSAHFSPIEAFAEEGMNFSGHRLVFPPKNSAPTIHRGGTRREQEVVRKNRREREKEMQIKYEQLVTRFLRLVEFNFFLHIDEVFVFI